MFLVAASPFGFCHENYGITTHIFSMHNLVCSRDAICVCVCLSFEAAHSLSFSVYSVRVVSAVVRPKQMHIYIRFSCVCLSWSLCVFKT